MKLKMHIRQQDAIIARLKIDAARDHYESAKKIHELHVALEESRERERSHKSAHAAHEPASETEDMLALRSNIIQQGQRIRDFVDLVQQHNSHQDSYLPNSMPRELSETSDATLTHSGAAFNAYFQTFRALQAQIAKTRIPEGDGDGDK